MTIVGLDLSMTATGYVITNITPGTVTSKPSKAEHPMSRLKTIADTIEQLILKASHGAVELIAVEGYSFGSRNSQAHKLGELGGIVRQRLWQRGWPYADVPPTVLKKYATGKGNANKSEVLAAAIRRLDYAGADDNEADALWLYAMALDHLGRPGVDMPAVNREALGKVEWP